MTVGKLRKLLDGLPASSPVLFQAGEDSRDNPCFQAVNGAYIARGEDLGDAQDAYGLSDKRQVVILESEEQAEGFF